MTLSCAADGWDVVPPSSRFDIAIEVDLIEEVGRIYGFSAIPAARSLTRVDMHAPPEAAFDLERAKQVLADRDYQEAITYSFVTRRSNNCLIRVGRRSRLPIRSRRRCR